MSRPLRIEYPDAFYHVMSRGDRRGDIVEGDDDRELWLATLGDTVQRFGLVCHAYCLMTNHYHLLIETPKANLSRSMRHLNGVYTQKFNRRHGYSGHVFQGRYKAILVEKESHGLELARYIAMNPVAAQMAASAEDYLWSSHRAVMGLSPKADWLETGWLLRQFGTALKTARAKYRQFVADSSKDADWTNEVRSQIILGSREFSDELSARYGNGVLSLEVERKQRLSLAPALSELLGKAKGLRLVGAEESVYLAHQKYGYTLAEMANYLGIHYSTVSKAVKRWREKCQIKT